VPPPAFTARPMRGNFVVAASRGSRIAAICSSVSARTRRNSPNIFMSSEHHDRHLAERVVRAHEAFQLQIAAERQWETQEHRNRDERFE
jgi:hypothetical protein